MIREADQHETRNLDIFRLPMGLFALGYYSDDRTRFWPVLDDAEREPSAQLFCCDRCAYDAWKSAREAELQLKRTLSK